MSWNVNKATNIGISERYIADDYQTLLVSNVIESNLNSIKLSLWYLADDLRFTTHWNYNLGASLLLMI